MCALAHRGGWFWGSLMFIGRSVPSSLAISVLLSVASLGQQKFPGPAVTGATELPVVMQQNVAAGKTPVGTVVRAKLEAATLVNGIVVPQNAVLSGDVVLSAAKTRDEPSQLAIRMNSVQWKNGSAAINVYLTAWYYPATIQSGQSLQYGPPPSPRGTWSGQGEYPNPNSGSYKPFPGADPEADKNPVPNTGATKTSDRRVVMKEIDLARSDEGTLVLVSKRTNIKLDKLTTYVFAAADSFSKK